MQFPLEPQKAFILLLHICSFTLQFGIDEETVFNGWVIFSLLDDIDIGPKPDPVGFYYVIITRKNDKKL